MAHIDKLSNEILKDILDHIESDPQRSIPVDRREYLSVESFRPPSPPLPSQAQDIGNFRLSCRRFAELGIPYQFTRVTLRFSIHGFQRLAKICYHSHLAKHTKKFSYLVPLFYGDGRYHVDEFVRSTRNASNSFASDHFRLSDAIELRNKEQDQAKIIRTKRDVQVLRDAMIAFIALQHVQILRLETEADRRLLNYLNVRHSNDPLGRAPVDLRWPPACYHATKTLAEALILAQSPFSRFSGPMMNPYSLLSIQRKIPRVIATFCSSLTCLEIHFEDGRDLDDRVLELSSCFQSVFSSAAGLQAVHIGFPTRTPLQLGLEEVFHNVRWDKLRAFGIQAWRLEADEIISLARRHKKTLRGLRLRDVLLKEGSSWKDVLHVLRTELEQLDWVSLRRIDYSAHFDEVSEIAKQSIEVPDDPPPSGSDSDEEDEFPNHLNDMDLEDESDGDDSDEVSDADTDHGPDANEFALSPDTPTSMPFCTCSRSAYPTNPEDLGDNGRFVTYQQRKLWEKWVCGRCAEHC
ncbi:hypothetical protein ACLMJK_006100 [Lecanora helva]